VHYLALVEDLLATELAFHAMPTLTDKSLQGEQELHILYRHELVVGHPLVTEKLGLPPIVDLRSIRARTLPDAAPGSYSHCPACPGIDERGRDLAVIDDPQCAMANLATRGGRNAIGEAPIGLDENEEALVPAWDVQP
jgi:hypothetical protein